MERYSRRGPRKYFQRCCYFFFFSKSKIILSLNYPIIQLVFIVLLSPRSIQEWVRQIPTSWSLESSGEADSVRDMPFLCDHFCHVGLQCWLLLLTSMHACMPAKLLQSCLTLCDPMDCSPQALLSMGFSRQEYWSRLPFPPPGDLPNPRIEPGSPRQAHSLPLNHLGSLEVWGADFCTRFWWIQVMFSPGPTGEHLLQSGPGFVVWTSQKNKKQIVMKSLQHAACLPIRKTDTTMLCHWVTMRIL